MFKKIFRGVLFGLLINAELPLHADPPVDPTPDTGNVLDRCHDFLSNCFYWPVAYTDQMFKPTNADFEVNPSYFRLIANYTWVNDEGFKFKPQVRIKVRLKALQRKLSFIAFGENENEASPDISVNQQAIARTRQDVGRDTSRTSIGFRYKFTQWFGSRFDADTDLVISKTLFPEPSLRGRLILYKSPSAQGRFTLTGFYKEDLKFGETTRLDYAQKLSKRWDYDATVTGRQSQERPDVEWDSNINLNYLLSLREAMALRLQAVGPTQPHFIVGNYRASIVYRRNFYRTWMFYEIEPGIDWPYENDGRAPVWSSAFRLELQFKSM